jgi:hypothetical protein
MPRSSTETRSVPFITEETAQRAERELARYFARRHDRRRRQTVEGVLAVLSAYHLGVLSLHYASRSWPNVVEKAFGDFASLAIRLDCCDHPASGSTPALETVAADRLAAIVAAEVPGAKTVTRLLRRATRHFDRAVRAYAKARLQHTNAAPAAAMDEAAE